MEDDAIMSVNDVLEITRSLSQEEKSALIQGLGAQIAEELTGEEVEEIRAAVAEGDKEIAQSKEIPAERFFRELGL